MNILLAEDDVNIRLGLTELLQAEGYNITACSDGQEAWEAYQQQKPDLLLLDIMMPRMDGYSLCKNIRKQDEHTPLIFLSAKSEEVDKVLGLELGADDFVMKPFGSREIIARIRAISRRAVLNEAQTQSDDDFHMADLRIAPSELLAYRGKEAIALSPRELKILQYLHQHAGKAVSRDALFDHAWGRNYLPSSRTLDQHVCTLRKRIETDPQNHQIIQTVHSVGYRYPNS